MNNIYGYIELDEDIIIEQLKNIKINELGFKDYKPKIVLKDKLNNIQKIKLTKDDFNFKKIEYNYIYKINKQISKLKDQDLSFLCLGDYSNFEEKMSGIGGLTAKNVKEIKYYTELMEKYGKIIGEEMEIFNIQLWLTPALNIHRNILCGRNFEYYSEDPLITGRMASAMVKTVQS